MRGLPPVGQQHVVGDAEQVRPERSSSLEPRRPFQDGHERVLRELLGPAGIGRPAAKKAPDRLAIAVKQRFERRSPAPPNLIHQLFVAHITVAIRVVSPPSKKLPGAGSRELEAGSWKLETGNWKLCYGLQRKQVCMYADTV